LDNLQYGNPTQAKSEALNQAGMTKNKTGHPCERFALRQSGDLNHKNALRF
jgi:hypothetical protein